ncbi:MAG: apolipoprotein N-acyltransferase [Pasteurellaceae bacterium]|nr:apolipoprotein N-acyltransferase [Pasteurellaceae bacterium]
MNKYLSYLIALLSGAVGVFAFSPFDQWYLAYVSLFGLVGISQQTNQRRALGSAFLWGLSFFSFGVSWLHVSIHQFGDAPLIVSYLLVLLLAAYLALYPLLFAYCIQRFKIKSVVLFPILWTLTEFLRGWIFTGFPWLQFGYTQIDSPFKGIAPIFGVTGLTFFTMWVSAALVSLVRTGICVPKQPRIALMHCGLLVVVVGLAAYSSQKSYVRNNDERALTITLTQGNIEQNLKWDPNYLYHTLAIYQQLISQHLADSDVIILPESALPALENQLQPFFQALQTAVNSQHSNVIIGTVYQEPTQEKLFNSITVVSEQETQYDPQKAQRYNKQHLVPFGEYVPLESLLRPLGSVFNLPMSAFQSGEFIQPSLQIKGRYFTPAICYEIILGSRLQQNWQPKTDFILTISNDAWFGDSIGPWQHLQMARMRALELGRPVLRATNTGITAFIDAQGNLIAQAPQFEQTTLTQKMIPTEGKTPYAVLGDKPLYALSFLLGFFHIIGALIKRKMRIA